MPKRMNVDNDGSTAVKKVAKALRTASLRLAPGTFLGSEEDLLLAHKVSRPTFRQAAALLAQEQVLYIKRGVGGGYISSRPKAEAETHAAAVFLQSKGTTLMEIMLAIKPIRIELARVAALSTDEAARARLKAFYEQDSQRSMKRLSQGRFDLEEYVAYLRSERDFAERIEALSGNRVLSLFQEILNDFCGNLPRAQDIYRRDPRRVVQYTEMRQRVIQATLDGDEQIAAVQAKRSGETLIAWLEQDEGDGSGARSDFDTSLEIPVTPPPRTAKKSRNISPAKAAN